MVSKQMLEIIIKAQDQASGKANEVDRSLAKIGKTGVTATNSTNKFNNALLQANNSLGVVGNGAHNAANLLNQMKLDPDFGSTMDRAKLKVSQMGYDIDSAKGKLMTFGTAGVESFNNLKQKVSDAGSSIKDKFGNALGNLKSELKRVTEEAKQSGQAFNYMREALFEIGSNIATDVIYKLADAGRASIESASKLQYFAGRLDMSSSKTQQFRNDLDVLQQRFRKVDMTSVGASAEELAVKLGMGSDSLTEMSETLAVASSAFVAEGRTQEDAILAVSDAIDGQWAKLKELGITQDDLKNNGWNGDLNDKKSLLEGLNATLEKMGFTKTAEDIVTLDDAMQALSVAGGILIQKVLVPITPFLLQIMGGLLDMAYALQSVITYIADNGWIQGVLLVGGLAIAFGLLAGAISVAEGSLMAIVVGAMPGFVISLYEAAAGFFAISVAGAPLWLILGIIVAVAIAVYELGIAFGWWKDVGSMLESISAGLQRMWSAFINHPDVQAAIQRITDGFNWLVEAIGDAWQSILDFFNISSDSNFDIVHELIIALGVAWDIFKWKIEAIMSVIQPVASAFGDFYTGTLVPLGAFLVELFTPVWNSLITVFSAVWEYVSILITSFQQLQDGQISLGTFLSSIWNGLLAMLGTIFSSVALMVFNFTDTLTNGALTAGANFVGGIITWLSGLPGRVYTYLLSVYTHIVTQTTLWVNKAKAGAREIVSGIINWLMGLPGKVYGALVAVVSYIGQAITLWKNKAYAMVRELISKILSPFQGLASSISSALSGVANAITQPFKDAWGLVSPYIDKIKSGIDMITDNIPFLGGEGAYGGEDTTDLISGNNFNVNTGEFTQSDNMTMDLNYNITLDLVNVPPHIDTNTLINAVSDKRFLSALTNNSDFQSMDAKVKERINLKNRRSGR